MLLCRIEKEKQLLTFKHCSPEKGKKDKKRKCGTAKARPLPHLADELEGIMWQCFTVLVLKCSSGFPNSPYKTAQALEDQD